MDDASLLALSVGGFFGGLLVTSRTLGWIAGLLLLLRSPRSGPRPSMRTWPVQLLLHSGPWLLALAVAAFVRVAALPWPALAALGGGFGFALAVVAIATGHAVWRHRHPPVAPQPLTPERLAEKRREFFLQMIAGATILGIAGCGWQHWSTLDRDYPIVIVVAISSALGAYLSAVILWQWFGTALEVAEKKRLQREARAAQAKHAPPVADPARADG